MGYMGYKGDMGTQGVTWGYMGLQRVTGGYKGLQGATREYRGLQRITETFFLARTSLDTFSWYILEKCEFCAFLRALFS